MARKPGKRCPQCGFRYHDLSKHIPYCQAKRAAFRRVYSNPRKKPHGQGQS